LRFQRLELMEFPDNRGEHLVRITEPVCGPDTANSPTQTFQYLLTQSIPVSGRFCRVIGSTITFNPHQVPTRVTRVFHRQINKESSHPNLRLTLESGFPKRLHYGYFEVGIWCLPCMGDL